MRLAIIADAHANMIALEAVLKDAVQRKIDHVIFSGDAVGYYCYTNEVCNTIRKEARWCVKGNHDAMVTGRLPVSEEKKRAYALDYTIGEISTKNVNWLQTLPEFLDLRLSGKRAKVFHGSPWNYLEGYVYPDYQSFHRFDSIEADFVILGHTHYPMLLSRGDKLIINPGSCGQPRDFNPKASYAILDVEKAEAEIFRVSYDVQKLIRRLDDLEFDDAMTHVLLRTR